MSAPATVHRWTLEIANREDLNGKSVDRADVAIERVQVPLPPFNKFLHQTVGKEFRWNGRKEWTDEKWQQFVDRPQLETWVMYVQGTPAGYFELEVFEDRSARIHNFGLLRAFFGQGLGAHLLTFAITRAFDLQATRLWLRTCTKDHPNALPNYLARGFQIVDEEDVPEI